MPLVLLGALVAVCVIAYSYVINHQDRFVRKKPTSNDPFDVIYLPADLEAEKEKKHQSDTKDDQL